MARQPTARSPILGPGQSRALAGRHRWSTESWGKARHKAHRPVSTRPEGAEIVQGDQRIRAEPNLKGESQLQELECRGAKSSGRLGSTGQLLTNRRPCAHSRLPGHPWWGVPQLVGLTLSTVPGCLKSLGKCLNGIFKLSVKMSAKSMRRTWSFTKLALYRLCSVEKWHKCF